MTGVVEGFRWALLWTDTGPGFPVACGDRDQRSSPSRPGSSTSGAPPAPSPTSSDRARCLNQSLPCGGLGKRTGSARACRYGRLTESITNAVRQHGARALPSDAARATATRPRTSRVHLADQGLNLDVYEGEVVGIVGRNGAGKTTLLKMLRGSPSRPQRGAAPRARRLAARGRHRVPSRALRARENVFLNGAILGMSRREIRRSSTRSSRSPRSSGSSIRGHSATRAACTSGSRSPCRRFWSPRS